MHPEVIVMLTKIAPPAIQAPPARQHGVNKSGNIVAKVVVPRQNRRDVLSVEGFYRALAGISPAEGRYALEIHTVGKRTEFVLRASNYSLFERLKRLVEVHWPQAEVHLANPTSDAVIMDGAPAHYSGALTLHLREAAYLPIWSPTTREGRSSYDDLNRAADPMLTLLSASNDNDDSIAHTVIQFVPVALPDDWARPWRVNTQDLGQRMAITPQNIINVILSIVGAMLMLLGGLLFLPLALLSQRTGDFALAGGLIGGGLMLWLLRLLRPSLPDPLIVSQKAQSCGFRCGINLYAYGDEYHKVVQCIKRMADAFSAYNLPNANGFQAIPSISSSPDDFHVVTGKLDRSMTPLEMMFPSKRSPILSGIEMSMLWHLPHESAAYQMLNYTTSRKIGIGAASFTDGRHEIGYVEHGSDRLPLRLNASDLAGNIAIFASTRAGKSNLMAWIAKIFLEDDPDCSVVVIDPHQSLAKLVASLVPENRRQRCIYWDLSNRDRPFGFNFLDRVRNVDRFPDRRMDNLINGMKENWPDSWGPRMEDIFRHALLTLLAANKLLVGEWLWRRWCWELRTLIKEEQDVIMRLLSIAQGDGGNQRVGDILVRDTQESRFLYKVNALLKKLFRLSPSAFEPVFESDIADLDRNKFSPSHPRSAELYKEAIDIAAAMVDPTNTLYRYLERLSTMAAIVRSDHVVSNLAPSASIGDMERGDLQSLAERFFYGRIYGEPPRILQYTLLDVSALLNDFRMQQMLLHVLPPLENQLLSAWWVNTYELLASAGGRFAEMVAPILTKVNAFAASPVSSHVFGQSVSTIDLRQVLNDGWVLLVNTAVGGVGEDTAALVGASIINWCASILYSRTPEQAKRRVLFIIDEFHMMPGANYEALLSELGKYGAQTVLATQSLEFLKRNTRSNNKQYPVLPNAWGLVAFRCSAEDARTLSREFVLSGASNDDQMVVTDADIVGLPAYTCFMRLRDKNQAPVTLRARLYSAGEVDEEAVEEIRQASEESFGRDVLEVSEEVRLSSMLSNINARLSSQWSAEGGRRERTRQRNAVF